MRAFRLWLLLWLLVFLAGAPAQADITQQGDPILRVEAGMHLSAVKRIDGDAAGRFIVTASDDKTVRVWDGDSGRALRVLRLPIGPGDEGKIRSVAISPDGALVAAGGWTKLGANDGHTVYLFDRASGRLRQRLTGAGNVVLHLAFSADGTALAAGLGGGAGVMVWRVADGANLLKDADYGGDIYGLAWDRGGWLVVSSYDGNLRLYDRGLHLSLRRPAPGGGRLYGVAFSPDGTRIALGYVDVPRVDILSASDLTLAHRPDMKGVDNYYLSAVAWSADGRYLYAGGGWGVAGRRLLRRWDQGGRGAVQDLDLGIQNTIMNLRTLPKGLLLAAADPAWMRLDGAGQRLPGIGQGPVTADMRKKLGPNFTLSADGRRVRFGLGLGGDQPVLFDLLARRVSDDATPTADLRPATITAAGLSISGWEDGLAPAVNGSKLSLQDGETSRSPAIAPGGGRFILGADWSLRLFGADGKALIDPRPVPGATWGVNYSGDGRLVVAAHGDGTIRWYRASDLTELLALFVHRVDKRWVAWTPSGYYMAGPGGEDLIGWHLNQGGGQEALFYPVSRFRDRFSRPDIVERILDTLDEAAAVQQADAEGNRRRSEQDLRRTLPPLVEILSPGDNDSFNRAEVTVRYRLRSPSGKPVTGVQVRVDDRAPDKTRSTPRLTADDGEGSLIVSLPPRDVTLSLYAETVDGAGPVASVRLRWTGMVDYTQPKLYALLIGANNQASPELKLDFPAKDATDMETLLTNQKGRGLYREIIVRRVPNPTRDNIEDGLDWLRTNVTGNDVGLLFMAGHGHLDEQEDYWFLAEGADIGRLQRTSIPLRTITTYLKATKGKNLFVFIDTCNAGQFAMASAFRSLPDMTRAVAELQDQGVGVVGIASSAARQRAQERQAWGNGALTKALLEGMNGAADGNRDRVVRLPELYGYVAERVKELTGGRQNPLLIGPNGVPDLPIIALAR